MKTGRKQRHYVDRHGNTINGLSKMPDGRWRVIGTQDRYTEPDEAKAIQRFYDLTDARVRATIAGFPIDARLSEMLALRDRLDELIRTNEQVYWDRVANDLRSRPKYAAERTGVEQLGYLTDLKPPEKAPTFAEIESEWKTHFKKSAEQKRRVLHAWADFKKTAGVTELMGITPEAVVAYRDCVYARGITGKMQLNIFTRIRRLFTFYGKNRAKAVKLMADVGNTLKLLVPDEPTISLNPQPIEVEEWRALLAAAQGEDRAMVLLMLNGAFYVQEVIRLRWSEIKDGCLVTHRAKHGRCVRTCVLWRVTLDALAKLKRRGDLIFYGYSGKPLGIKGAELRFRNLRDAARISVTSSQLRDGAATAAASANVNEKLVKLLLGHRSGIADHYVKRNPGMVLPATDAVYSHYFPLG